MACYDSLIMERIMALHWPTALEELRARVAAAIHAGKGWVIPEDEMMAECGVDMALDGADVGQVVADLAAYFDLDRRGANALRALLTVIQRQHLADSDAQAERRSWARASAGRL